MRGKGKHEPPGDMQPRPPDNASAYVMAQVKVWADGGPLIHFESAQEIAAWWHSPAARDVGFCTFSHTGQIICDLVQEIDRERREQASLPVRHNAGPDSITATETGDNIAALNALQAYVERVGWECPGATNLYACDHIWSADTGCAPKWTYGDAEGNDITGSPTAERDAVQKAFWTGPDGPSETWVRGRDGNWQRDS
jgi:hypothetical protein